MGEAVNKRLIITSLIYKFLERIGVKFLGFIISVILARLIAPEIFGTIAIITAIIAIAQVLVDSGLSTALIQAKYVDDDDYSTILYISIAIAIILYIILYVCAPLISNYYDIDDMINPLRILMVMLIFEAPISIQTAMLTRKMQFKKMFFCQLITTIVAGVIGIVLAYQNFGIWALVMYYLLNAVILCITLGIAAKWLPKIVFSIKSAKALFNYGYKLLFSGLLCAAFNNLRVFIIGKIYTPYDLGYYTRGEQIPSMVSTTIEGAFNSVMFPVFSRSQDDISELKEMLRKTIKINAYIVFPAMFGLTATANSLVEVLYTDRWIMCVPYLQILSLSNLYIAIMPTCLLTIKAIGKSDVYLKLETVRRIIMLIILIGSIYFGSLMAIAIGWLVSTIIDTIIIMVPVRKYIGYRFYELLKDISSASFMSLVMFIGVILVGMFDMVPLLSLILQIILGVMIYIALSHIFKVEYYVKCQTSIKSKLNKRKQN